MAFLEADPEVSDYELSPKLPRLIAKQIGHELFARASRHGKIEWHFLVDLSDGRRQRLAYCQSDRDFDWQRTCRHAVQLSDHRKRRNAEGINGATKFS